MVRNAADVSCSSVKRLVHKHLQTQTQVRFWSTRTYTPQQHPPFAQIFISTKMHAHIHTDTHINIYINIQEPELFHNIIRTK